MVFPKNDPITGATLAAIAMIIPQYYHTSMYAFNEIVCRNSLPFCNNVMLST